MITRIECGDINPVIINNLLPNASVQSVDSKPTYVHQSGPSIIKNVTELQCHVCTFICKMSVSLCYTTTPDPAT